MALHSNQMSEVEDGHLGDLFDAIDAGLIVLNGDKRVAHWNRWLVSASGIAAEEATGKPLQELFPGAVQYRLTMAIAEALEAGLSSLLTHALHPTLFPLRTRAGQDLVHNVLVRPIGAEPYSRCLIQIDDITLAAHRERALRKRQNARYDAVMESAPDAILTLDAKGTIQLANPAAARQFGYAPNELLGQRLSLLLQDQKAWDKTWEATVQGKISNRPLEVVARRKDGTASYLEVSASRWHSDSRTFVTAILRDVNEQRAAQDALWRLNQTLEQRVAERTADRDRMWRLSNDVMIVAKLDGTINAINPAWTQLFGWTESTVLGSNVMEFVFQDDRPKLQAALQTLSKNSAPQLFDLRLQTRDCGIRWIEWSAVAADGLLQAVGRDVTAERAAEQALQKAENALRHSQKMEAIGQLTGGIAHDFNNLLTGIIGSMHMLKRRIVAGRYDDTQRFMDAAITSANRAAALTHRLLAFARRQPLDLQAVSVNLLVRGMEDLLRRTLGEQVELATDLGADIWPTFTDPHQLENALLNLAINARDAMPDGGRLAITTNNVVFTETERHGEDEIEAGEYIVICVGDTGVGMAPEVAAKVFEPFFTTKPIGQGTGLGLSMVYGFMKQSHGQIRIESTLGKGTKVNLYLPRHSGRVELGQAERSRELPHGAGETVLLVEDDSSVRLLIGEVLRELGYACIEVSDSQAALPMLVSTVRLDLMITDVGLPGLNGRQLAQVARQQRPDLKILFVTGYAEHATDRAQFLEPGMDMVTKPFTPDLLALKVREIISK